MIKNPPHHSTPKRSVQRLVAVLLLALLAAHPVAAKQKHAAHPAKHAAAKHKVVKQAPPPSDTAVALKAASNKEWENALMHARKSGDPTLVKLVTWMYLQDPDGGATFNSIASFIRENPQWPQQQRLRLRAEQSLRTSEVPDGQLYMWFEAIPPVSGIGKVKLAELLLRQGATLHDEKVSFLIRDAWRNGDFEENEEKRLLTVYADVLQPQDSISRIDRMLWDEKTKPARRMLELLNEDQRALMRARIALIEDSYDTDFYLSHVPRALLADPGLTYERIRWRARKGDAVGARNLLLSAPQPVPYPDKWWKIRDLYIRDAVGRRDYELARRLLVNHGLTDGVDFADAAWLSGWLQLRFLNQPREAYLQFYHMFDNVKFAVSKARAAYWAGRAAEAANDAEAAHGWYLTAAVYPTTFYGQLAYANLHEGEPLRLPADPVITEEDRAKFNANDLVHAVHLAARAEANDLATSLVHHLVDTAPDAAQASMAAALGQEIHQPLLAVRAAKRAGQRGIVLTRAGYPVAKLPQLPIEPQLALAIVRQESEFDSNAKSKSGAVGMMQLLPKTAKEMARKVDMPYAESRLYEPSYNIQLGSAYLGRLINSYGGSYVLATAAYNAGPGNVREWMYGAGAPHGNVEAVVDWIEQIPFAETRNYVQRVMENLQVYRSLTRRGAEPLSIAQDLTRAASS